MHIKVSFIDQTSKAFGPQWNTMSVLFNQRTSTNRMQFLTFSFRSKRRVLSAGLGSIYCLYFYDYDMSSPATILSEHTLVISVPFSPFIPTLNLQYLTAHSHMSDLPVRPFGRIQGTTQPKAILPMIDSLPRPGKSFIYYYFMITRILLSN